MRKFCAFLFVICYIAMSAALHAETIEVNGKSLKCEARGKDLYHCLDGKSDVLVAQSDVGFIAVKKGTGGYPLIEVVSKISNNDRVLYMVYPEKIDSADTLAARKRAADIVASALSEHADVYAKELVALSQKYLNSVGNFDQVSISINPDGAPMSCTRGESHIKEEPCDFFSCTGKDPAEKLLAFIPSDEYSTLPPNVLSMKKEETRLFDGGFKIINPKGQIVDDVPVNEYAEDYLTKEQKSWVMDSDLFIPKSLEHSKSSFNYVRNTRKMKKFQNLESFCSDSKIKALFNEKRKIADQMDDELAKADIIEYLKIINGEIESLYVDKQKGLGLGCIYQGRVLGSEVAANLDYLHKIANPKAAKKYLSEKEVQDLFFKAKNMKDIPFGYKMNGCFARAHIMARRFEAMGIPTQKAWIKGRLFVPGTDLQWAYHVAPLVEVKDKNGQIQNYVIDPSLTDKAVTLDEWVAKMGKNTKGPVVHSRYPIPDNVVDFQRTTVAISSSDAFATFDLKNMTEQQKMNDAKAILKKYSAALAKGIVLENE